MSNRLQSPGETFAPEPGKALALSLLPELRKLRGEAGLRSSDVRKAEQLIRAKTDLDQIRNGVQELYRALDPFDPEQEKLANVYAELDKVIRELAGAQPQPSTAGETVREPLPPLAPLPPQPQPGPAAIKSESPVTPEAQERIADLLSDIRGEVKGTPEGTFSFPDQLSMVEGLIRKRASWSALKQALNRSLDQSGRVASYLQMLCDAVENQFRQDIALRSGIETLQSGLRAELEKDPDNGLRQWFQTYAFCLSDWRLERCSRLVDKAVGLPDIISLVYSAASQKLVEGDYAATEVDEMLKHLIDKLEAEGAIDEVIPARLRVLRGRVNLYHRGRPEVARSLFEEARELCPTQELPAAAIGEYYLKQPDLERAEAEFKRSLQLSDKLVDGHLGMGQLHEGREQWAEADQCYDRAADLAMADPGVVADLEKLLAPAGGRAYLRLALKLRVDRAEPALQAVTRALDLGIEGEGGRPQAEAFELKAEILARLGRNEESAEAFAEAARYFEDSADLEKARECLESAIRLDSGKAGNYWKLADVYLSLSYGDHSDEIKRGYLERGTAAWNAGAGLELPDETFYWAYTARAGLAFQESELLRGDEWPGRIDRLWQVCAMIERLLLIMEPRALDWIFLARALDRLYLYQNALKVTEEAFEMDPDDLFVAEWRMFVLCNTGHFEEAIEKAEHRLKLSNDVWIYSIFAWVNLHQGRYREAKEHADRAFEGIEPEKMSIWDLNLRANINDGLKDLEQAKKDWQVIYGRKDENDIDNLGIYASAAYGIGKREEAFGMLQLPVLLNDRLERPAALRDLGLLQLRSGQAEAGWPNLEEGVSKAVEVRSLSYYLAECKEKLPPEDAGRVEALVRERVEVLERPKTLDQELIEASGAFGSGEDDKSWIRVGIQASLARIYREEGRWLDAANLYRQLLARQPMPGDGMHPFPEARQGLELCATNVEQLGDEAFKENQAGQAIEHYEHALLLGEESMLPETTEESLTRTAGLHAKLSLAMLDARGIQAASDQLAAALKLYRRIEDPDSIGKLAGDLKSILRDGAHYWQVHDVLKLLMAEQGKTEDFRRDIVELDETMSGYLEELYRLGFEQFDPPSVLPVVIDIGDSLIPEDTSVQGWFLFNTLIPEMRIRIKEEMGVSVPGIRVRELNDAPSLSSLYENYRILLDEVPVTGGRVRLDRQFCPHGLEEIEAAGISKDMLEPAEDPRTGKLGYWLDRESAGKAAGHKLELWDDPLKYMIQHLEVVLRRNLANFMGIEEVQNLLNEWKDRPDAESLIETELKTPAAQLRFSRMLRELVRQQKPVTDYQRLFEAFKEKNRQG